LSSAARFFVRWNEILGLAFLVSVDTQRSKTERKRRKCAAEKDQTKDIKQVSSLYETNSLASFYYRSRNKAVFLVYLRKRRLTHWVPDYASDPVIRQRQS
jgi:hypothetical protein